MYRESLSEPRRAGGVARLAVHTLQWLVFALTNTLPVPLVIAAAVHLSPTQAVALAERVFFVTGAMSLAQLLFGHRLPIVEGPAGMWWAVMLSLGMMAPAIGMPESTLRSALEFGMIAAGLGLAAAAIWKRGMQALISLFTPAVSGAVMVLLAVQLAPSIASALIGSPPSLSGVAVGAATFLAVLFLSMFGRGIWRSAGLLVGVTLGTLLWVLLRLPIPLQHTGALLALPTPLAWGPPRLVPGVLAPSLLTGVLLLSNLIASLRAMQTVTAAPVTADRVRRAVFVNGLSVAVSGVFAVPGAIPYASNAGFVSLSRNAERLPFLLFSAIFALLGLFPPIGRLVVALPQPVVYAALLASFGQLLAIGISDLMQEGLGLSRSLAVMGPILLGIGIMGVPQSTWRSLHTPMAFLFGNGMIVGLVLVLILVPFTRIFRQGEDT